MARSGIHKQRTVDIRIEKWPLKQPFRITGYTFTEIPVVYVKLEEDGVEGEGEACGVYYLDDTPEKILEDIENIRTEIEGGVGRLDLQSALPPGGARNALDCALWDLEAKQSGVSAWRAAGIERLHALRTTFTIGATTPAETARAAKEMVGAKSIKLKLTGEDSDVDRVFAARSARPEVWLGVDANQGYSREFLEGVMSAFVEARVSLVEQPLPIGKEQDLYGYRSPIPLAADESVLTRNEIARVSGLFQYINIKLDKCGGLTEALEMVSEAKKLGLKLMVGNMMGTSLSTLPAFVLGQFVDIVDLDGPFLLSRDRIPSVSYEDGYINAPTTAWGAQLQAQKLGEHVK